MIKKYTGIGSRKSPDEILELMEDIGNECYVRGLTLRSGGADGADSAFENGAGNLKEIYLPWKKFNDNTSKLYDNFSTDAQAIAKKFHRNWNGLSFGAKKLHARNVHQVLGKYLESPSDFLVCWTEGGKEVGGTATAIKIAKSENIPVFNLGNLIEYDHLMRFLRENYD